MTQADNTDTALIVATAERIFADQCSAQVVQAAEAGSWPVGLFDTLDDNGLLQLGLAASGTGLPELFEFLRVAGRHAAPLPLADLLLSQQALARAAPGTALVPVVGGTANVPWPDRLESVLLVDPLAGSGTARLLPAAELTGEPVVSIAGEPQLRVTVAASSGVDVTSELACDSVVGLYAQAALGRVALLCGALEQVLQLALRYATEREQFGRSISKFQAIQHQLAVVAAEVAAAQRATDAAFASSAALGQSDTAALSDVAIAKIRVGAAAGVVAEAAHQVHGAMGFTREHRLHHFTRRLWQWRDDCGTETQWAQWLGEQVCEHAADDLWAFVANHE